jgi:hypothetical protein
MVVRWIPLTSNCRVPALMRILTAKPDKTTYGPAARSRRDYFLLRLRPRPRLLAGGVICDGDQSGTLLPVSYTEHPVSNFDSAASGQEIDSSVSVTSPSAAATKECWL